MPSQSNDALAEPLTPVLMGNSLVLFKQLRMSFILIHLTPAPVTLLPVATSSLEAKCLARLNDCF